MIYKLSLIGQKGLNKDIASTETSLLVFNDCQNVRFIDGSIYQRGGIQTYAVSNTPILNLQHYYSDLPTIIYSTSNKIFRLKSNTHTDISLSSYTFGINQISSILFSGFIIINNINHLPQVWSDGSSQCINLPNFPSNIRCKSLRKWNNILIALNLTKSGTRYPHTLRWSHPADPGTLPPSWDITNPAYDAGEVDITEGYDEIVDGLQLRNTFIVYKENSVWRMDYIGSPYIFELSNVSKNDGIIGMNAVAEVDNYHVVFGNNDLYIHDGKSTKSIADKRVRRWLFNNIDENGYEKCFTVHNINFKEVWFCFPSLKSDYCNMAVVWNYNEDNLSIRDLPNITHSTLAKLTLSDATWNIDEDTWDADLSFWDRVYAVNVKNALLCSSGNNRIYLFDNYPRDINAYVIGSVLKSNILFEDERGNKLYEYIKLVKAIRPRITGHSNRSVLVSVGLQEYIDGPITWVAHMPFVIDRTYQCDCLVAGRIFAVRIQNIDAYYWECSSIDIECEIVGKW